MEEGPYLFISRIIVERMGGERISSIFLGQ